MSSRRLVDPLHSLHLTGVGAQPVGRLAFASHDAAKDSELTFSTMFLLQVSAHSLSGDWRAALDVRRRMAAAGAPPSVHVYNALIAAAERAGQFDAGLALHAAMAADGVAADSMTAQLLAGLGRAGAAYIGGQQAAVTALSAAVAAAGSVLIHNGAF